MSLRRDAEGIASPDDFSHIESEALDEVLMNQLKALEEGLSLPIGKRSIDPFPKGTDDEGESEHLKEEEAFGLAYEISLLS